MSNLKLVGAAVVGAAAAVVIQRLLASKKAPSKIKLGYWKIRGLGAPLRMMLAYSGAQFEEVQYTDPAAWFGKKKPELLKVNALANLPYLEVDDTVVSESNACFTFLADTLGMSPTTCAGKIKDSELLSLCKCTRDDMTNRAYPFNGVCADRAAFDASMKKYLEGNPFVKYEAALKLSGTPFFCGAKPSACDFHIFEMLDQFTKLATELKVATPLATNPLCGAFHARFKALPTLQAYFASESYTLGCNASMAHWY